MSSATTAAAAAATTMTTTTTMCSQRTGNGGGGDGDDDENKPPPPFSLAQLFAVIKPGLALGVIVVAVGAPFSGDAEVCREFSRPDISSDLCRRLGLLLLLLLLRSPFWSSFGCGRPKIDT